MRGLKQIEKGKRELINNIRQQTAGDYPNVNVGVLVADELMKRITTGITSNLFN